MTVYIEDYRNQWLDIRTDFVGFQPEVRDLFQNIVLYSDLPYYFNIGRGDFLRYTGYHYGYVYNKHERNNDVWLTFGLKKNWGFLMPFFL